MYTQKRIKTQGCQLSNDISSKKQRRQIHDKSSVVLREHKQSQIHLKSASKDITPKKHSMTVKGSKAKQIGASNKKIKNKQLISICSYSGIDKQSMPITKRKGSGAYSIKKKQSKNKQHIHSSLKSTVTNFGVLTKCLTQYIKQEKKKGKDPSKQILQLIKAFNKSQVAPLSKQLELLISNMLNYIENAVQFPISSSQNNQENECKIKSRSSFSGASQKQIVYSQILENSIMPPTTIKKQKQYYEQVNGKSKQLFKQSKNSKYKYQQQQQKQQEQQEQNDRESQQDVSSKKFQLSKGSKQKSVKYYNQKQFHKQLQKQLKYDLKNMHDQLQNLKSAGEQLQNKVQTQHSDKKKLQEIYAKNKKMLQTASNKNSFNLKNKNENNKSHIIPLNQESEQQDENQ